MRTLREYLRNCLYSHRDIYCEISSNCYSNSESLTLYTTIIVESIFLIIYTRQVRGTPKVDAEFEDLKEASEAARAVKNPFRNLLKPRNRPQLIIGALGIPAFQQLTGQNSILFYAPVIFQSLGFGSGASLYASIITGSMLVVGALVSMSVVDRLGRRFLFIEAGIQMIGSMVRKSLITTK